MHMQVMDVPDTHALLDIRRADALAQVDDELGDLLDVDDIFALFRILLVLYDLRTPCDLQRLLLLHALSVGGDIPEMRRRETRIGFLRTM